MMYNRILKKIKSGLKKILAFFYYYSNTYKYNPEKYYDTFLINNPKISQIHLKPAPKIIYTFWTGDNELTPNRKKGLQSLIKNAGVEVKLITPKNLSDYILPDYPLRKAYKYLSLNHRSDYLRAYFMLHYGGGYADIKMYNKSWKHAFNRLNKEKDKWVIGYQEKSVGGVAFTNGKLGKDLVKNYLYLIGNGSYIFKPYNPISKEAVDEIESRLDFFYEKLIKNPAIDPFGSNSNYPIPWNYMGGHIIHALILKYSERILKSESLRPLKVAYR